MSGFGVDLQVTPGNFTTSVTITPASSLLIQPRHGVPGVTPVGENESHTVSEGISHRADVTSVSADIIIIVAVTLTEFHVDGAILESGPLSESLISVNALSRTVTISPPVPGVSLATTTVAATNETTFSGIAVVRSSLGNEFVRFHDIHLPAPDATNLVGITVVVTT